MAQAQSAQREPSMEEILASIRRITEDGDTERPGLVQDAIQQERPALARPSESAAAAMPRVDGDTPQSEPGPTPRAPSPSGFDEAGARKLDAVRQFPADAWRPEPEAARPEPAKSEPVAGNSPLVTDEPREEAAAPVAQDRHPISARPLASVAEEEEASLLSSPAMAFRTEQGAASPKPVESIPSARLDSGEPVRPTILSPQAGRQVAAAFGELSEAFEASRRRTFDEIAAEMMRPMLQDWLDNNLPRLVEKLVREEIERIARGSVE